METIDIKCSVLDTSDEALKIFANKETWLPRKFVMAMKRDSSGFVVEITIPVWLAKDRGIT